MTGKHNPFAFAEVENKQTSQNLIPLPLPPYETQRPLWENILLIGGELQISSPDEVVARRRDSILVIRMFMSRHHLRRRSQLQFAESSLLQSNQPQLPVHLPYQHLILEVMRRVRRMTPTHRSVALVVQLKR